MSDIEFIDGLSAKAPRQNAPEFVKASVSIKRAELLAWLQARDDEWINVDIKEAQSGKWYAAVNAWRPEGGRGNQGQRQAPRQQRQAPAPAPSGGFDDDSIPF